MQKQIVSNRTKKKCTIRNQVPGSISGTSGAH